MSVFIGIALLLFGGGFFARQAGQLPRSAWAGPRTAAQRQRGAVKPRTMRQELKLIRAKAQSADWLELRRHERKTGTGHAAVTAPARPSARDTLTAARQRWQARRAQGGGGTSGRAPVTVIPPGAQPRWPQPPRGGVPAAAPPSPNGSPGRNTTMAASGNAVEQFVEGVNQIHAHAQAGGIRAKLEAVKAAHEACVRFSAMAQMLSRQMREPGMNYGNEITEPIGKAGVQLQASAMEFSEADAALTSLLNMTVGDLAQSSRQAPHHTELSENGSH